MGMGIPLICNKGIGDTDLIIDHENIGIAIDSFDEKGYDKAISHIDNLLKIPSSKIRKAAHTHFSLEKGIKLYEAVYHKVYK